MSATDQAAKWAGRLKATLGATQATNSLSAALGLAEVVLGVLAEAEPAGPSRAAELIHDATCELRSSGQVRGDRILDAIVAELAGLKLAEAPPGAPCDTPSFAADLLAADAESLAGAIQAQLDSGDLRHPADIRDLVSARAVQRLQTVRLLDEPESDATERLERQAREAIGRALGNAVLASLADEPSVRQLGDGAFRRELQDAVRDLALRLDRIHQALEETGRFGALAASRLQLIERLAAFSGAPTRADLERLEAHNRPLLRLRWFRRLREQLCVPLGPGDILELATNPAQEQLPPAFCYVPHALELIERTHGAPTAEGASRTIDLAQLVELIAGSSHRLLMLVEAPAGFGKTTFMYRLAWELAKASSRPLPVLARVVEASSGRRLPTTREGIRRSAQELLESPRHGDQPTSHSRHADAVHWMLDSGRLVALVDGLDQVSEGHTTLLREFLARRGVHRLVASCRQELGASAAVGWTHSVRLAPPSDDDLRRLVPEQQLSCLHRCLAGRNGRTSDAANPFMLHVVRVLGHFGRLPAEDEGLTDLLDSYLGALFEWGRVRPNGSTPTLRWQLTPAERLALGVLGLTSHTRRPSKADDQLEQRIDGAALDEATQEARRLAQAAGRSVDEAAAVLATDTGDGGGPGQSHLLSSLARVAGRVVFPDAEVYLFHHQLLQEHLAASGLADAIERELRTSNATGAGDPVTTAVAVIERYAAGVLAPRPSQGAADSTQIPERVRTLRFWELLAHQLAGGRAGLTPLHRAELAREITRRLTHNQPDEPTLRTAMLRIRDEMMEHDPEMVAVWADEHPIPDVEDDPVWSQCAHRPDPFMVLFWEDERQSIEGQLEAVDLAELEERLRSEEPSADWRVRRDGYFVVADARKRPDGPRWLLVPPGPFVAGSWKRLSEQPAIAVDTPRAILVAHDPVTVPEFAAFLDAHKTSDRGYDLQCAWWEGLGETEKALGGRREPWEWVEQLERQQQIEKHPARTESYPVVGVSWFEAAAYCRWLSWMTTNEKRLDLYRLPIEAEWEKASRGLAGRVWPWGSVWQSDLAVCGREWELDSLASTGNNRNLSPYGLRGAAGNVWEWTCTAWQDRQAPERVKSPGESDLLSMRGGSFVDRRYARCECRFKVDARGGDLDEGFRCVRDV